MTHEHRSHCRRVGACSESAPFARLQAVATILDTDDLVIEGDKSTADVFITAQEWHGLIDGGEALRLRTQVAYQAHAWVMLFGASMPDRGSAHAMMKSVPGSIIANEVHGDGLVLVVNGQKAAGSLAWIAAQASDRAHSLAETGDWPGARDHADLAWLIDPSADRIAMYALTTEHVHGVQAGAEIIDLECRSQPRLAPVLASAMERFRRRLG